MIHAMMLMLALQAATAGAAQHEEAGLAALKAGSKTVAIEEFKEETEQDPQSARGYYELGIAYESNQDYESAIPPLKKAVDLDSNLPGVHKSLGYALLAQGYAAHAVTQFKLTDDNAGLGIAQLEAGDLPNAVRHLQDAANEQPNNPDLLYYLARATGLLSKELYDLLITSYPKTPRAEQALAENYTALRQYQLAADHYQAALRDRPDVPGVYLALGEVYAKANLWSQAEDAFREECKLQPGNAEAAYRLGSALLQDGNAHEASLHLERANQLQPDMSETLYSLGKAEVQEGNYAVAEKAWRRVIEIEETGELASQAHFGLAGIYRRQGNAADAAREMKLFVETRHPDTQ